MKSPTRTTSVNRWFAYYKPNTDAKLRLFCFPYAGGEAQVYRRWTEVLPPEVEVCPVQLPGRGSRLYETPFVRVKPLLDVLASALLPYLDRPFALFGHSMGAILAFELARRLKAEHDLEPQHLFVSGRPAPGVPDPNPPTYSLPEPEFLDELRRLNGTPPEVLEHPELMQLLIPLIRADFELVQTYSYEPGPALDCPISAFGGLQDAEIPQENMEAWHQHTRSYFLRRMLPGDHFFFKTAQPLFLQLLSSDLAGYLKESS